ncbi:MAG TPA: PQQ-binding-like beta-propeller repeat protein [Mycobacteriales bacterium]|nr:PQQ-binding-like beta-propeller repeat protein [Mycobacteriales bacterium]
MQRGREWRRWLIGAAVVLVAAVAVAVPAIADSDWYTLNYRSLSHAPKAAPSGALPASLQSRWSTHGIVQSGDLSSTSTTVVTVDQHELYGRDPVTGSVRWHYRRGNTDLCAWTMDQSTVIAVFRNGASCSDITGFDADTGKRRWYLNADLPSAIQLLDGSGTYYAVDSGEVTGFYADGGSKAWSYTKAGCTFDHAVGGDVGLVLLADCSGRTDVIAVDGFTGKERFDVPAPSGNPRLLSADSDVVVASDVGRHTELSLYGSDGHAAGVVGVPTPPGGTGAPAGQPVVTDGHWIGFDGTEILVIDLAHARLLWTVGAVGPPAVHGQSVLVPGNRALADYDSDGRSLSHNDAPALPKTVSGLELIGDHVLVRSDNSVAVFG